MVTLPLFALQFVKLRGQNMQNEWCGVACQKVFLVFLVYC